MKLTFKPTYWYKVTYPDGEVLIFQVLGTTADGFLKYRLCDGSIITNILEKQFTNVIEIGTEYPCK